ncbi:MAG TPA: 2-polyprenyl-3-methyl-6-methoxy-1,4-benzoquinone monooxygenase [Oxalicibacterium sp.]|uniref:2-polyprenyl-3-methyl-6-methoxy-1,4-benzoquinone monooxygenase n=1 Tax=Oxalicibacterium sp. TaxID=2766525 RepID=UPI002BD97DDE|nr:2-polyprenyl-3-methyl-6-methoxy-1,4-benzoquinone monooxygenase [Oxalicibacterium sp.]HWU98866.1 2-polyprenyl-3-methyl-6-methoxy-1,4-benzoquinone monooxygenase [Oxalicibacterium sp.]
MYFLDRLITDFDSALRTMAAVSVARRPSPAAGLAESEMDTKERRHSAGLMRVNHVGEVCAQALYQAQAKFARSDSVREKFLQAGQEEEDHLAWTAQRLQELGSHPSLLNPLWYTGSYLLGTVAAALGDARSLGFVVETERQVEAHLNLHMGSLPSKDMKSLAIVAQMSVDEAAHGAAAKDLGAQRVPPLTQKTMRAMAKVMTTTAYYI